MRRTPRGFRPGEPQLCLCHGAIYTPRLGAVLGAVLGTVQRSASRGPRGGSGSLELWADLFAGLSCPAGCCVPWPCREVPGCFPKSWGPFKEGSRGEGRVLILVEPPTACPQVPPNPGQAPCRVRILASPDTASGLRCRGLYGQRVRLERQLGMDWRP